MTDINKDNDHQTSLLETVFTRWISIQLKGIQVVNDITKDLSNGVALIELAQVLTRKKAPRAWDEKPTSDAQNVKNCKLAFRMFRNDGFRPIGITSKNISDNNEKQIIEYIWQLISYYSINNSFSKLEKSRENISDANIKNKLLSWAIRRTQNYKQVFAFKPYDKAICALLDSYYPSKIKYYVLDPKDRTNNFKRAIDVMNELGIPCLILPEDFNQNTKEVDKKALLTQLALARLHLEVKPRAKPKRRAISVLQQKSVPTQENPNNTTIKKVMSTNDRLMHTQIPRRKARSETKPKREFSAYPPIIARQKMLNDNAEDFNAEKDDTARPKELTSEQQKIENEVVEDFNADKEAYEEQKLEDNEESKIEDEKEAPIEEEIDQEFKENAENYKERKEAEKNAIKKAKKLTKEEKKIERKIIDDFKDDKEAFKERKLEEKEEKKIEDEKEAPIEEEIDQEFKENEKAYRERKQEEKNSMKMTKDQISIEKQIDEDFKENRLANNKRKQEDKIEKEKMENEELKREGINPQNDRRPTFINFV